MAERGKMKVFCWAGYVSFVCVKIGIVSRTVEQYFCLEEAAKIIKCGFLYIFSRSFSRIMKHIADIRPSIKINV